MPDDLKQLRALLREAVRALRIPVREWERRLGVGHGNFDKLLDGSLELRVRHIVAFAQLLRVSPGDLLDTGCPELVQKAEHRVSDWVASASSRTSRKGEPAPSPALSEEIVAAIREAVRQELAGNSGPKKS